VNQYKTKTQIPAGVQSKQTVQLTLICYKDKLLCSHNTSYTFCPSGDHHHHHAILTKNTSKVTNKHVYTFSPEILRTVKTQKCKFILSLSWIVMSDGSKDVNERCCGLFNCNVLLFAWNNSRYFCPICTSVVTCIDRYICTILTDNKHFPQNLLRLFPIKYLEYPNITSLHVFVLID